MRHSCIQATEDTYVYLCRVVVIMRLLSLLALEDQPWSREVQTANSERAVGNDGACS